MPAIEKELHRLEEEDEIRLLKAFQKTSQPELFTLMFITGISFQELSGCRVCDYQQEQKKLQITQALNRCGIEKRDGNPRIIPLSEPADRILQRAIRKGKGNPADEGRLIFTTAEGEWLQDACRKDIELIRRETGLQELRKIDIRNSFGIRAVRLGVNYKALNRYMGFCSGDTLTRFVNASRDRETNRPRSEESFWAEESWAEE